MLDAPSLQRLEASLTAQRKELTDILADITQRPSVRRAELRAAVAALARLGDSKRAHTLLLSARGNQCRAKVGGGTLMPDLAVEEVIGEWGGKVGSESTLCFS